MFSRNKSWLALCIYALLLFVLTFLIKMVAPSIVHEGTYYIILFFLFLTLFTHYITLLGLKHIPDKFAFIYLGTMTFRLLISLGIILIVLFQKIPERITFVVNFALIYLAFLIFEIYALLTTLRSNFQTRAENAEKKQEKSV